MIEAVYIIFCIALALDNSERIKENKKINHWLNGSIHIAVAAGAGYFINWLYVPTILLTARLWFNTALNVFRGLDVFYVTPTPKSFQDKAEQWVFKKNGMIPFIIYFIAWDVCNYYLN